MRSVCVPLGRGPGAQANGLNCGGRWLDLSRPRVMGILNVTPDSFSDGGRYLEQSSAVERAQTMVAEGAAVIDVGGESTRPGSFAVSVQEQLDRVLPVVEALHACVDVPISIDTSQPEVMREAVAVGAGFINDVRALRVDGALDVAAGLAVPVCLMHMSGEPHTMQDDPQYSDVVGEVRSFLLSRIQAWERLGMPRERLLIDPGFGFGKTLRHNLDLLRGLPSFADLGVPLLVGLSQKSMIGQVLRRAVEDRLYGSVALAVLAVIQGATVIRAHDVRPTVEALQMAAAVMQEE